MIGAGIKRHERLDRRDEIIGHGAADAAIGQFHDVFRRAIGDRAAFEDVAIDAHIAEFIDHHGQPFAAGVLHQVADQSGLAGAEKAGDHGNGEFGEIGHCWSASGAVVRVMGGMRATQLRLKCSGRSRHGISPSPVA